MAMTNMVRYEDILQNPSYEEWKASRVAFAKRDLWLDRLGDLDKNMVDSAVKARTLKLSNDMMGNTEYLELTTDVFSRFLKLCGAKAVIPKQGTAFSEYAKHSGIPDICLSKMDKTLNFAKLSTTLKDNKLGTNVQLATWDDNPILAFNHMVIAMYDQITPSNISPIMDDFPEAMYPAIGLFVANWSRIKGMTSQNNIGAPWREVTKRAVEFDYYQTQRFAEKIIWYQEEVIGLRNPGSESFMDRGLPIFMSKSQVQLEFRRQTRIPFDIYRAIFDGEIYSNGLPISYGIDPTQRLTGSQFGGAPWATFDSNTGAVLTVNPNVNVYFQLRNFVHATLKRYAGYKLRLYMNSLTLSAILDNPSINTVNLFGPGAMIANGRLPGNNTQFETLLEQFLGTNNNVEVVIDDSQYIADENDPLNRPVDSEWYLCDTGRIFIAPQVQSTGAGMGEYAYTPTVQNGGMTNPQPGPAYFMVDTFASNTIEGTENPVLTQNLIWSALPLLFRKQDLFTLDITK